MLKFNLIVLGLLVVGYAHWPWTGRLAAQAREDSQPAARQRMVEEQIKARSIKDEGVLAAMLKVPRERFVPSGVALLAVPHGRRSGRLLGRIGNGSAYALPLDNVVALTRTHLKLGQ